MKDTTFTLAPTAAAACPPYTYGFVPRLPRKACWRVRDGQGRAIGEAHTRAGARAAVRDLYQRRQDAEAAAAMRSAA